MPGGAATITRRERRQDQGYAKRQRNYDVRAEYDDWILAEKEATGFSQARVLDILLGAAIALFAPRGHGCLAHLHDEEG